MIGTGPKTILSPRTTHDWFVDSWMQAPSLIEHGVGFTTGGGGGGVSEDGAVEDGAVEDGGVEDDSTEDDEGGPDVGVSACTELCAHPASDINATAATTIRTAHPLVVPSLAEVDDRRITRVAQRRPASHNGWETGLGVRYRATGLRRCRRTG
ncbi:hypothetical protein Lesp01_62110 [Lentzea sp. NBRC 102530]|nr:hypothetical protein Lesp01_62110 [Lentzea sp. NBRC 102530]